jgi:hypothetical protein
MLILAAAVCLLGRDAEAASKIRLGVLGFESMSSRVSTRQAEIIADIFTRELAGSKTIAVYERQQLAKVGEEVRRSASGLVDVKTAVEVGKLAGVQFILLGSVTELYNRTSGQEQQATVTLDVRVIGTETSEVRLALSETGFAAESGSYGNDGSVPNELSSLEVRAISDAATRLSHAIRVNLGQETSHVVAINGQDYVIDIGSMMGVRSGAHYLVYAEGNPILDLKGNPIGKEKFPLAILTVRQVQSELSVCAPTWGYVNQIRRGDLVEPISPLKAGETNFVTNRTPSSNQPQQPSSPPPDRPQQPSPSPARPKQPAFTPQPNVPPVPTATFTSPPPAVNLVNTSPENQQKGSKALLDLSKKRNATVEEAERLIAEGADVNAKDGYGSIPLHFAVEQGNLDVARLLLDRGANVNAKSGAPLAGPITGRTPLHIAVAQGNFEITRLLLDRGADINAKDGRGSTPLSLATGGGNGKIIRLLRESQK